MEQGKGKIKISNTMLWIGGTLLLLSATGVGYIYYRKRKKGKSLIEDVKASIPKGNGSSGSGGSGSTSGFCKYNDSYPLKQGSCGKNVSQLQTMLKGLGADLGRAGVDGKFGKKTAAASKKYLRTITPSQADINRLKRIRVRPSRPKQTIKR